MRSVWTIATAPYPGAHFATFPPKLVEPCIKAGTSERGVCPECGAPWQRVVETSVVRVRGGSNTSGDASANAGQGAHGSTSIFTTGTKRVGATTGWRPGCAHEHDPVPAVVLDCFAGTGTVGLVAAALSRRAVLIDLNAEYLRQCIERNRQAPLGLLA